MGEWTREVVAFTKCRCGVFVSRSWGARANVEIKRHLETSGDDVGALCSGVRLQQLAVLGLPACQGMGRLVFSHGLCWFYIISNNAGLLARSLYPPQGRSQTSVGKERGRMGKRKEGQRSTDERGDAFSNKVALLSEALAFCLRLCQACWFALVLGMSFSVSWLRGCWRMGLTLCTEVRFHFFTMFLAFPVSHSTHPGPCRQTAPDPREDGAQQTCPRGICKTAGRADQRAGGGKGADSSGEGGREGTEDGSQAGARGSGRAQPFSVCAPGF